MKLLLQIFFVACAFWAPLALSNSDSEPLNQLTTRVLKNKYSDDCPYMGGVVLESKFHIMEADIRAGELLLEGSSDGVSYYTIESKSFEGRKGHTKFRFDAGDCLQDARVTLTSLN